MLSFLLQSDGWRLQGRGEGEVPVQRPLLQICSHIQVVQHLHRVHGSLSDRPEASGSQPAVFGGRGLLAEPLRRVRTLKPHIHRIVIHALLVLLREARVRRAPPEGAFGSPAPGEAVQPLVDHRVLGQLVVGGVVLLRMVVGVDMLSGVVAGRDVVLCIVIGGGIILGLVIGRSMLRSLVIRHVMLRGLVIGQNMHLRLVIRRGMLAGLVIGGGMIPCFVIGG